MEKTPIHFIARCTACAKKWEGQREAISARAHARNTGHIVRGEIAYAFSCGDKKFKSNAEKGN